MATQAERVEALKKLWVSTDTINEAVNLSNLKKAWVDVSERTTNLVQQAKTEADAYKATQTPTVEKTVEKSETITPSVEKPTISSEEIAGSTDTEIKQEWALKPLSQEYYNNTSDDAQNKIINNLNTYKQTNPELFNNYESFQKNFSYNARDDIQKQTLDNRWNGYQTSQKFNWLSASDIYTQYNNGSLSNNDIDILKTSNPSLYSEYADYQKKANIIASFDDDKNWMNANGDTWEALQNLWMQNMANNLVAINSGNYWFAGIFDEYEAKMNSPEMTALSDEAANKQEEIEKIQQQINSIKQDVEQEYSGTGATASKINAIISDRTYDLQQQLQSLNSEYNKTATQYNNRLTQYQNEYNMQIQEYQLQQQERNQVMNELGFAMDLMSFQTPEQKMEMEFQYKIKAYEYENWNINSKDTATQLKAIQNSVNDLLDNTYGGIPTSRSREQIAKDIQTAMQNWSTFEAEMTKLNQQMQSKWEYKILYNQTFWGYIINPDWSIGTAGTTNWGINYNVVDNNYKLSWVVSFVDKLKGQLGQEYGQCWKLVNDYLEYIGAGRIYDNELQTKLNSVNSDIATPGSIAVWDNHKLSWNGNKYGHVAIVTKDNGDGTVTVLQSNWKWDEKLSLAVIKKSSLLGFFDPSKGGEVSNDMLLSEVDRAKKWNYIEEAKRGNLTNTDVKNIGDLAAEQGRAEEWQEALNEWMKNYLTDKQQSMKNNIDSTFKGNSIVTEFEESINQIEQLQIALNDTSGVWDMSAIFTFMKTLDPTSVVRESEFNSAANTAWVLNPSAIWQKLEKSMDWKFLTDQQRQDFKKIAIQFIKTKANNYNIKYDELARNYNNAWIDSQWLPTNMAEKVISELETLSIKATKDSWVQWLWSIASPWYVEVNWLSFPSSL